MRWAALVSVTLAVAGLTWPAGGCSQPVRRADRPAGTTAGPTAATARGMRTQSLAGVVAILSALDRYEPGRSGEQAFDRLVQWQHAMTAAGGEIPSRAPALFDTLPARLREVAGDTVARASFDAAGDITAIRDRCWLAAVARTARGDAAADLAVAENLFRWTIRSLAPVSDPPMVPGEKLPGSRWFFPGEILLAGRGSAPQRAWIFLELLRQAGLDGVMLATGGTAATPARPWLPAVVIDGEAYLFEPAYGMPVPGPGGRGVATIRQAATDSGVLESLSLPERRYPVQLADLTAGVSVLVPADGWSLSGRMAALDRDLADDHGVRVSLDHAALAARALRAVPEGTGSQAAIWTFPWETVARRSSATAALAEELGPLEVTIPDRAGRGAGFRPLFAGRVREFRGELDGPDGAKAAYLAARPSRRVMNESLAGLSEEQAAATTRALVRMKEDATYWLGLLMLAEGQHEAAIDYLGRMTLQDTPDSRWTDAARLGVAAALAGLGRDAEAAVLLRQDGSPQRFGSRLMAARLEAAGATPPTP